MNQVRERAAYAVRGGQRDHALEQSGGNVFSKSSLRARSMGAYYLQPSLDKRPWRREEDAVMRNAHEAQKACEQSPKNRGSETSVEKQRLLRAKRRLAGEICLKYSVRVSESRDGIAVWTNTRLTLMQCAVTHHRDG